MAQHDNQHGTNARRRFLRDAGGLAAATATAAAAGPALAQATSNAQPPARPLPFLIGRSSDTLLARGNRRRILRRVLQAHQPDDRREIHLVRFVLEEARLLGIGDGGPGAKLDVIPRVGLFGGTEEDGGFVRDAPKVGLDDFGEGEAAESIHHVSQFSRDFDGAEAVCVGLDDGVEINPGARADVAGVGVDLRKIDLHRGVRHEMYWTRGEPVRPVQARGAVMGAPGGPSSWPAEGGCRIGSPSALCSSAASATAR